jgi:hypothetical protein
MVDSVFHQAKPTKRAGLPGQHMKRYIARAVVSLCPAAIAGCFAVQANAQMLTFEFSGTLTQVVLNPGGNEDNWGSVGDPFWGTLSFDPTRQNAVGPYYINPQYNIASYQYDFGTDPVEQAITMSLSTPSTTRQIGNTTINASFLQIGDSVGDCTFTCWGEYGHDAYINFNLADATGSGISGFCVPSNLNLNDWATHYVDITGLSGGDYVRGEITAITLIPEPRVEMMIGLGFTIWSLKQLNRFKLQADR